MFKIKFDFHKETITASILITLGLVLIFFGIYPFVKAGWYRFVVWPNEHPKSDLLSFDPATYQTNNLPLAEVVSTTDKIVIPSIGVDMEIISKEGITEAEALLQGAWLLPRTGLPNREAGNTVIAGHRFLETSGSKTFFNLDKLQAGDKIYVYWQGEEFVYEVTESKVVKPTAVEILKPTDSPILTLFTCTPVFTTKNRLVVIARLST